MGAEEESDNADYPGSCAGCMFGEPLVESGKRVPKLVESMSASMTSVPKAVASIMTDQVGVVVHSSRWRRFPRSGEWRPLFRLR